MKKKHIVIVLITLIVVSLELVLRVKYGFCDTVLFSENASFEYIPKPNQYHLRFGNHIKYNSESMRSEEISTSAYKILCFGDSVINGGVLTDQDSLATSLLSASFSKKNTRKVQFLNIAAGSWGPDNCYAYLKKYGDFGAKEFILFVSSHDAYDNMDFQKVVGTHPSYPSKQFKSAIYELIDRYLLPKSYSYFEQSNSMENLLINKKKPNSAFNSGFSNIFEYAKNKKIAFTIYLHADRQELEERKYNEQGQKIIEFAKKNNINIIMDLENGLTSPCFRDELHLNAKGQENLAKTVQKEIQNPVKPISNEVAINSIR